MAWTVAVKVPKVTQPLQAGVLRETIRDYSPRMYLWTIGSLQRSPGERVPLLLRGRPRRWSCPPSAFVALLLASVGLYGVMAMSVQERTRELGIRRALGASAQTIRYGRVMSEALRTSLAGCVAGLLVALPVSRLLEPLLYEVGSRAIRPRRSRRHAASSCS